MFEAKYSRLCGRLADQEVGAWEVHDRAMAMERAGEDVILLCVGDPDFRRRRSSNDDPIRC